MLELKDNQSMSSGIFIVLFVFTITHLMAISARVNVVCNVTEKVHKD